MNKILKVMCFILFALFAGIGCFGEFASGPRTC